MEPNSARVVLQGKVFRLKEKIKNADRKQQMAILILLTMLIILITGWNLKKSTVSNLVGSPAQWQTENRTEKIGAEKTNSTRQWEKLQEAWAGLVEFGKTSAQRQTGGQKKVLKVPETFPKIQSAIDNAAAGDVVLVGAGEFKENLVMKNGVSVVGIGAGKSILDGERKGAVVYFKNIPDKNTRIENFTIKNASAGLAGVLIEDASPLVNRNEITNNDYGIYVKGVSSPTLQRNLVNLSKVGVQIFNLSAVSGAKTAVIDNKIFRNQKGVGLYNAEALVEHNTLSFNNSYTETGEATFGVYLAGSKASIRNNLITENGICELCAGIFADEKSQGVFIAFNDIWNNRNNFVCFGDCVMENTNFSEDPQFESVENLNLKNSSPFLKAGSDGVQLGARL